MRICAGLVAGDESNWDADRDDPVDLAKRFEQQGQEHRDPYLMGLAANNYARARQTDRAALCRAAALEYDGRGVEAGNRYADLGQPEDAARCFWRERELEKLRALAASVPRMKRDLRCEAASIAATPQSVTELPALLRRVAEQIEPGKGVPEEIQGWESWLEGLLTLERRQAISTAEATLRAEAAQAFLDVAAKLTIPERRLQYLGPVLTSASEYSRALTLWEAGGDRRGREPDWVVEARARTAPLPAEPAISGAAGRRRRHRQCGAGRRRPTTPKVLPANRRGCAGSRRLGSRQPSGNGSGRRHHRSTGHARSADRRAQGSRVNARRGPWWLSSPKMGAGQR